MQLGLGFLAADIRAWHDRLAPILSEVEPLPRRSPIGQLIKSMISGRTRDAVSQAAYDRLRSRYRGPAPLADADPAAIERVIGDVTFAADKSVHLVDALRLLRASPHGFRLDFLGQRPLPWSLAFLERLPGVGRKVAASTLNASTLDRPVLIVDTHVLRVLRRLGAVSPTATAQAASEAVTAAMAGWTGGDFLGFHIMTKRLGQTVCHADAPCCTACPLARSCLTAGQRRVARDHFDPYNLDTKT